ncbi:MAG: nucleoside-diphosphate sugar epimerase, partial [Chloroflexi bacterium]|nr:nucleoside-diphosphate sugar epimerase [Chloroflexota bacterium]
GQGNSLVAMAEHIGEALGVVPEMHIEPSRVGEVTHYVANIGKARAILGYNPQTPLREGIHKAVAWCLEWWEKHPERDA